jgi:hypothetical protein
MILHLAPGSSLLARAGADALLTLHIGGASVGLVSGTVAAVAGKGGRLHRAAGDTFFVSMLIMSAVGAAVAPFLPIPQWSSTGAGIFTFYLVATDWATARRREGGVGGFEIGAAIAASGAAAAFALMGWVGAHSPDGMIGGVPYRPAFVFAALAGFAAACDARMILAGGATGAPRVARHLWRMCVALFIAAGSFFLGQPKVFPPFLRGSPILFVPEIAILGLLVFWLLRVGLPGRARSAAAA